MQNRVAVKSFVLGGWLLLALVGTGRAQDGKVRKELEACYEKAAFAAELKFVEGMLSNRAADFALYGPTGQVDLSVEREKFQETLLPATRVKLETRILNLTPVGAFWVCSVEQTLQVETVGPGGLENRKIRTLSEDAWRKNSDGWRIAKTLVNSQEFSTTEGLARDYLRPTSFIKKTKPAKKIGP